MEDGSGIETINMKLTPVKGDIMKRKYLLSIIGLFLLLLTLVTVSCYHKTPEQRADHVTKHLISTLDLDTAQTAKLEKMKEEFLAKRSAMRKAREESISDLKEMMLSPQIDKARLNAHLEKIQTLANDMIRFMYAKFVELHDMLTPEQRTKLMAEIEKYAKRAHRWL